MADEYALHALSPLDGRYQTNVEELSQHFSEFSLIKYRQEVELEYWNVLLRTIVPTKMPDEGTAVQHNATEIFNFTLSDALNVKTVEKTLRHDVKAVEQYVKTQLLDYGFVESEVEFVHFGLTSHDINSLALNMQMRGGIRCITEHYTTFLHKLIKLGEDYANIPMLARTHGQPATPVTLGTQFSVYANRLRIQLDTFKSITQILPVKFGGATGGMNAHYVAYPNIDWQQFVETFLTKLQFARSYPTTQVEYFDKWSEIFDCMRRINGILLDYAKDIWLYISYGYLSQANVTNEIGSSTMPHKINPIHFENAEGNLLFANVILQFFSQQFQQSRMQRDLVNSTLWRNVGVAFGHTLLGIKNLQEGTTRITPNFTGLTKDLDSHYEVLSEPMQILLKSVGEMNAYDTVKEQFRGVGALSKEQWLKIVDALKCTHTGVTKILRELTPSSYALLGHHVNHVHIKKI